MSSSLPGSGPPLASLPAACLLWGSQSAPRVPRDAAPLSAGLGEGTQGRQLVRDLEVVTLGGAPPWVDSWGPPPLGPAPWSSQRGPPRPRRLCPKGPCHPFPVPWAHQAPVHPRSAGSREVTTDRAWGGGWGSRTHEHCSRQPGWGWGPETEAQWPPARGPPGQGGQCDLRLQGYSPGPALQSLPAAKGRAREGQRGLPLAKA